MRNLTYCTRFAIIFLKQRYGPRTTLVDIHRGTALTRRFSMNWLILVLAGLLEVGWAVGLKYSEGFTQLVPSVLTVLSMAASVFLLGVAIKTLPLGTAYVIWVGIGAVGTAIVGMLLFSEPVSFLRVASLFLIVIGVVGLKFSHGG